MANIEKTMPKKFILKMVLKLSSGKNIFKSSYKGGTNKYVNGLPDVAELKSKSKKKLNWFISLSFLLFRKIKTISPSHSM